MEDKDKKVDDGRKRALEILTEAISGHSPKSQKTLIKDAIRCLKNS
jgi:hypothetical protein